MQFSELAGHFDRIEQASSRLKMTGILAQMLQKCNKDEIAQAIYLSQGALGPSFAQPDTGLGEKLVEDSIARSSGFTKQEINSKYKQTGDLGNVAQAVASKKKQQALFTQQLSIKKVFENFEKISGFEGSKSQDLKIKTMAELLNSATPIEARYIARIPLSNMRLGIGDPSIMDALALNYSGEFCTLKKKELQKTVNSLKEKKDEKRKEELERKIKFAVREMIEEKYNIFPDLGKIAQLLKEKGLQGLKEVRITPGTPIRPTLAERLPTADEIIKKLGKCLVESKYDGLRLQIHKNGQKVTIFSRQNENVTAMFPEIVEGTKIQVDAGKAIIEGEALALNEITGEYFPFQITMQRKRKYLIKEKSEEFPLNVFLFDIMLLENQNQMDFEFEKRRKTLSQIIKQGDTLKLTNSIVTDSPKEVEKFFEQSIAAGLEGIIAKDLKAKYIAGARKFAWIKLKRSYKGELSDTVDVVIIGYFKGRGKRTQFGLGGLLTAVYNKENDTFESIAKIGTGMSEKHLSELESTLSKIKSSKKPPRVESELEPDFWVEPKMVIEVRADEITKSPVHMAAGSRGKGMALRFPRMTNIRSDKKPEQATSSTEILHMFRQQKHVKTVEGLNEPAV